MSASRLRVVVGVVSVLALWAGIAPASASTMVVVSNFNAAGWAFFLETGAGSGAFVTGPAMPPLGSGSAQLAVTGPTGGMALGTVAHAGTVLADMTTLQYSTYRTTPATTGPVFAAALQFGMDFDSQDGVTGFQGRLVFEPYLAMQGSVLPGTWQTWNPRLGRWWATRAPFNADCKISAPCPWATVLALFPDARIHPNPALGVVLFKAGSGWSSFDGNVDAFTIGVSGADTTYDFEFEVDTTPPDVTCSGSPNELWPPNHRMVGVTATVTVSDSQSGPAGFTLDSVTSSEADEGLGDGDRPDDVQGFVVGTADTDGDLRAERSGSGDGRTYTLTYVGADNAGNTASCSAEVIVPHDRRS